MSAARNISRLQEYFMVRREALNAQTDCQLVIIPGDRMVQGRPAGGGGAVEHCSSLRNSCSPWAGEMHSGALRGRAALARVTAHAKYVLETGEVAAAGSVDRAAPVLTHSPHVRIPYCRVRVERRLEPHQVA